MPGVAYAEQTLDAESVVLVATSAEQFALIGGVFLILGGAFVFAPQIISAVNGFFARLFGRPRKTPAPKDAAQPAAQAHPPGNLALDAHEAPPEAESEWAPPPEAEPEPGRAVSRLRDEISSAWGRHGHGDG